MYSPTIELRRQHTLRPHMKRRLHTMAVGFIAALAVTAACGDARHPVDAGEVSATDVDHFVSAWGRWTPGDTACVALEPYWSSATRGLESYARKFGVTRRDLCAAVRQRPERYAALASEVLALDSAAVVVRAVYASFDVLHHLANSPSVYFVVGNGISAGSTTRGRHPLILVGAEMVRSIQGLPWIVAHELVHTQQDYPWFGSMTGGPEFLRGSLLRLSITEGSADFIASLVTGRPDSNAWAEKHEAALWKQFLRDAAGKDYSQWLYNGWNRKGLGARPADLGYWIGYRITQSYYQNAPDKRKAIADILSIRDFTAFLNASKYDGAASTSTAAAAAPETGSVRPQTKQWRFTSIFHSIPSSAGFQKNPLNQPI